MSVSSKSREVRPKYNQFCRGEAISTTYSERMSVALFIQHAKRMRRIVFSSLACMVLPYYSTLSHKRHDFRGEKNTERKMCVLIFSTTMVETFLIVRRNE